MSDILYNIRAYILPHCNYYGVLALETQFRWIDMSRFYFVSPNKIKKGFHHDTRMPREASPRLIVARVLVGDMAHIHSHDASADQSGRYLACCTSDVKIQG